MSKSIGMQLRQARQERGLTFEEVAQATRIRVHYIRLLEAGEFSSLPSKAQAHGFLRSYASYLELDSAQLLEALEHGTAIPETKDSSANETSIRLEEEKPAPLEPIAAKTVRLAGSRQPVVREENNPSRSYFIEIGEHLQRQRELLGLSLEEIERHTRLRTHYLQALEAGNLQGLPSTVQGRGMLNNYAVFLGLDPEPLLLQFAEGLQAQLAARKAASQPSRSSTTQRRHTRVRRFLSGDLVIGGVMGFLMIAFVIWGALRILSARSESQAPVPSAPSIIEVLLASPTATASPTLLPSTLAPPPTLTLPSAAIVTDSTSGEVLTAAGQGNVQLYVAVQHRTWLRVIVDGELEFEGRVIPGSAFTFVGDTSVEILAGNGIALQLVFNQQELGVLGEYGEVVNLIFTAQGVLEPTPTITATPTETQPFPALPTQTSTLSVGQGTPIPGQGTPALP